MLVLRSSEQVQFTILQKVWKIGWRTGRAIWIWRLWSFAACTDSYLPTAQIRRVVELGHSAVFLSECRDRRTGIGRRFVLALVYIISNSSSTVSPSNKATGNSANTSSSETKSNSFTRNETFDRTYTGTIGKKNPMVLTMALKRENNILSGRADTPGSWDRLSGSIQNDGSFFLNGNERDGPLTGTYTGRINDDGSITGTYRQTNGKSSDFSASQKVE